jgi:glycosyltransferase involved in cell wall biosynthesis
LPCVATAVGGNPALLSDGLGMLVPPGDVTVLSQSLYDVVTQADALNTAGRRAREHAVQHFAIGSVVREYERLFQASATGRRA